MSLAIIVTLSIATGFCLGALTIASVLLMFVRKDNLSQREDRIDAYAYENGCSREAAILAVGSSDPF